MRIKNMKKGFTLAEMLIVVFIISILAATAVPFFVKKHDPSSAKPVHGRYECYYNSSGVLWEREYSGINQIYNGVARGEGGTCKFTPNTRASYFIVQIVGGGGGGAGAGTGYLGATAATDHDTGSITIPTDGSRISLAGTPTWLTETVFNNATVNVTAKACNAGGDGGAGNGDPRVNDPCEKYAGESCTTFCTEINKANCTAGQYWYIPRTGATGGKGGCVQLTKDISTTTSIFLSQSTITMGSSTCTAYTGTKGNDATTSADGSPSPAANRGGSCFGGTVTTGGGGAGGAGGVGFASVESSDQGAPGTMGSSGSFSFTPTEITYKSVYPTRTMTYGQNGRAGEFKTLFIPQIKSSNIQITVGNGGANGIDNGTVAQLQGGDGQTTSFGGTVLVAKGGTGGKTTLSAPPIALPYTIAGGKLIQEGMAAELSGFTAFKTSADADSTSGIDPAFAYGYGGKGGGSWTTCLDGARSNYLNGIAINSSGNNATCYTDVNFNGNITAEPGLSGVVVIIW